MICLYDCKREVNAGRSLRRVGGVEVEFLYHRDNNDLVDYGVDIMVDHSSSDAAHI